MFYSRRQQQLLVLCWATIGIASALATMLEGSSSLPATYRALVAESTGSSFGEVASIATRPMASLVVGDDDAVICVKYAGVNGGCETFRARGEPGTAFSGNREAAEPFGLGAEGVGIVAAVGAKVTNVRVGDAVCFVGSAFSEYSLCKASTLWSIPDATPEYVGLRVSALTACAMLEQTGKLRRGETVLITAAAGGAGHFAVQFAKMAGCTVIGTCGSAQKAKILQALGCDHVINYKTHDVRVELQRLLRDTDAGKNNHRLDVVLEGVGGELLQTALDFLAPEGRLLQIGYISEYPHNPHAKTEVAKNELDAADIFWNKKTVMRGKQTIYGNAWPTDYAKVAGCQGRVLGLFAEGKLKSLVDESKTFEGLEAVSDAISHMLSGTTIGKVVVKL